MMRMKVVLPDMRYTLCFLTRGESLLMLHRRNPPNQGLWNGVGGRLEQGETPRACAVREVYEETGFRMGQMTFGGILTWEGQGFPPGGLYLFTAAAPDGEPRACDEGPLDWKPREWVFTSVEVVSNIALFGPLLLDDPRPRHYRFFYKVDQITDCDFTLLEADGLDQQILLGMQRK